jgi:V8-like Glu-specific endopeptidase
MGPSVKWVLLAFVIGFADAYGCADLAAEDLNQAASSGESETYEQLLKFEASSIFYKASHPVGQLWIQLPDGDFVAVCTGMVISSELVLTAKHCVFDGEDPLILRSAVLVLGRVDIVGGESFELDLDPADVGETENDFVVLKSKKPLSDYAQGIPRVGKDPVGRQGLYIIHFPALQPMVLSRKDCRILDDGDIGSMIRHTCQTQPGSSGAPILNESMEIVGMHLAGGKTSVVDTFNRGITISEIIQDSDVVKKALLASAGTASGPERPTPTETASIKLDNGGEFVLRGNDWFYDESGAETQVPVKLQRSGDSKYLFWNPTGDVMYSVPKLPGPVTEQKLKDLSTKTIGNVGFE